MSFIEFCLSINILCCQYELSIISWFRTESYNGKVGGKENSLHKSGMAVDGILNYGQNMLNFQVEVHRLGLVFSVDEGIYHFEPIKKD